MSVFMKVCSAGMALLFIVWAYYQHNDPDPFLWILVYAVAALASVLFLIQRLPLVFSAGYFAICGVWALYLLTQLSGDLSIYSNEILRELVGLVVICIWMGVLSLWLYRGGKTKKQSAI